MQLLPKWVLTQKNPAFYDSESATVIEQTAKIHGAMNELIEDYNKFVETINKQIVDYESGLVEDMNLFAVGLRQEFQDFINVIDLKYTAIEQSIEELVDKKYQDEFNTLNDLVSTVNQTLATMQQHLNNQDEDIEEAIQYLKTNLPTTVSNELQTLIDNGELTFSNPNLLINGDFRINQRGLSSYTGSGYGVDMWKVQGDSTTITEVGSQYDGYIKVQQSVGATAHGDAHGILQWIEGYYGGKVVTISLNVDDVEYSETFTMNTSTYNVKVIDNELFYLDCGSSNTNKKGLVELKFKDTSEHTIRYIKLELGNVATPLSPRPCGEELALCQRYLLKNINGDNFRSMPVYIDSNKITFYVLTPVTLRGIPSLLGTPETDYYIYSDSKQTGFTFNVDNASSTGIIISANKSNHGLTIAKLPILHIKKESGFSAEL